MESPAAPPVLPVVPPQPAAAERPPAERPKLTPTEERRLRLRERVTAAAGSGAFLVLVILYTIRLAIGIFALGGGSGLGDVLAALGKLLDQDVPQFLTWLLMDLVANYLGGTIILGRILLELPSVLTMIGLWMIYSSVHTKQENLANAEKGLRVIKVTELVMGIFQIIVWFVVMILAFSSAEESIFLEDLLYMLGAYALVCMLFFIGRTSLVISSLNAAIFAPSRWQDAHASGFVAVVLYIGGVLSILGGLVNLSLLLGGVISFLFARMISKFNRPVGA